MLDLRNISIAIRNTIIKKYGSQKTFAEHFQIHEGHLSSNLKNNNIHSLTKIQEYADYLESPIEIFVLPGLTQAAEYIQNNIYNPSQKEINTGFKQDDSSRFSHHDVGKENKEVQEFKERYFDCIDLNQKLNRDILNKTEEVYKLKAENERLISENTKLKNRYGK